MCERVYMPVPVLLCVFPWYSAVFPFYAYFPQHILEPRHSLLNHPKGGPLGYNIYIVSSRLKSGLSHQQHQRCPPLPFPPLIYVRSLRSFIITVESIAALFLFCFFLFLFFFFIFLLMHNMHSSRERIILLIWVIFCVFCRCQMWCLSQQCFYHLHFK